MDNIETYVTQRLTELSREINAKFADIESEYRTAAGLIIMRESRG